MEITSEIITICRYDYEVHPMTFHRINNAFDNEDCWRGLTKSNFIKIMRWLKKLSKELNVTITFLSENIKVICLTEVPINEDKIDRVRSLKYYKSLQFYQDTEMQSEVRQQELMVYFEEVDLKEELKK